MKALADLGEDRFARGPRRNRFPASNRAEGCRRNRERGRIEEHRERRPEEVDHGPRDTRSEGARERVRGLELAVRIDELSTVHDGRKVGLVGDIEEDREDSDEKREHIEIGEVEEADDSEDRDRGDHRAAAEVREDEDGPLRPSIDPDADQEAEQQEGNRPRRPEEPHLDLVRPEDERGDVGDGEARELVSNPGDGLSAPEEEEVPMTPEGRQRHARPRHGRPRYLSSHAP